MKSKIFPISLYLMIAFFLSSIQNTIAQKKFPENTFKNLDGKAIKITDVLNKNGLTVVSFWATWCKPCLMELGNIHKVYPQWQKETGVKIAAISMDDPQNASKVGPFMNKKGWKYDVFLDSEGNLAKAMGIQNIPQTYLLNEKGEIIWEHNSYTNGDEKELYEVIKKHSKK